MGTHIKNMYIYIPQIYTSIYIYIYSHIYIYTMHVGPSSPTCALRLLFLQIHVQYIKDFAPVPVHVAVTCFPFRRVPVDSPVAAQPQPPVKCSVALIIMFRMQFCNSGSGIIATLFARRVKVNPPVLCFHVHTLRHHCHSFLCLQGGSR